LDYFGIEFFKMYPPSDDSYFFAEFLKKYFSNLKDKNISYLDMGSGSGILAETAKKAGIRDILATDINSQSVKHVKSLGIKAITSNLFSKIPKSKKFDLITFNAPYLPESKYDKLPDTSGGKEGDEVSLKFLKQAKKHLNPNGKIFLLISSQTPIKKIKKFNPSIVAKKKLFFEQILILKFSY